MELYEYLNGTTLKDLFGLNMKSDEVVDLLDRFDLDVVYQFDRLREGAPDSYSARALAEGFEFQFDERQVLETIWCYIRERHEFSKIDPKAVGTYVPSSFDDAKAHAITLGLRFSESTNAGATSWVRLEQGGMWTHYEFADGELSLITLMRPWS